VGQVSDQEAITGGEELLESPMWERVAVLIAVLVIWLAESCVMFRVERGRWRFSMRLMFVVVTLLAMLMFFVVQVRPDR
jgi:hypothetical protein